MSVGAIQRDRGHFGVVGHPQLGTIKQRRLVEEEELTPEAKEALEADTFIIYGKASVERYDEDTPPQKIEMEAFEKELPKFLENGIISRRHKDIPIGDPLESYTLEEPADVVVGEEVLEFDAGDTLETGVRDDELWIVADLRNDSEIARETRHGALTGELAGFSVTVFCKEWEETPKGQRVTEVDWHSTTIGADEHIKNKDSRFGVAEFKAMFGDGWSAPPDPAAKAATLRILRALPTNMSQSQDEKGFWDRVRDIASQKAEEADPEGDPESGKAGHGDDEYEDEDEKADVDAVLEQVKEELGAEQYEVLDKALEEMPNPDDEYEEDYDSAAEAGELKALVEDAMEEAGFVTEDTLASKLEEATEGFVTEEAAEEKAGPSDEELAEKLDAALDERLPEGDLATKSDVEEVMKAAEEVLTNVVPDIIQDTSEQVAEKMETGGTPDPTSGSGKDQQDYMADIQAAYGSGGD